MKTKHLESFGSAKYYQSLIASVYNNNNLWRKVANILGNIRRDLRDWPHIDKTNQRREAEKYAKKSLTDTKLPDNVKQYLKDGINAEFNFNI